MTAVLALVGVLGLAVGSFLNVVIHRVPRDESLLRPASRFVAVTARLGVTAALPAYLYLAAVGVALAVIDLDVLRLPDRIVLPSYAIGGLLLLVAVVAGGEAGAAWRAVAAAAAL